jgi:hypothetical protein
LALRTIHPYRPQAIAADRILTEPPFYAADQRLSVMRQAQSARAPFPPLVEQAMLFGFFAFGAAFWVAVIWLILR